MKFMVVRQESLAGKTTIIARPGKPTIAKLAMPTANLPRAYCKGAGPVTGAG